MSDSWQSNRKESDHFDTLYQNNTKVKHLSLLVFLLILVILRFLYLLNVYN